MSPLRKRILSACTLLLLIAGAAFYGWEFAPLQPPPGTQLQIKPGTSLSRIATDLAAKGVIRSALVFHLLARVQHKEGAIQAGSYAFETAATPNAVLTRLVVGDVMQTQVTIPEGFTLQQIIERLAAQEIADRTRLRNAARDPRLLARLGIASPSLEGFLFPETYRFVPGIDAHELLGMMVEEFERQYRTLLATLERPPTLNKIELVTLASIIQKETGLNEEMPLISSVFHNRLRRGIPLQTDPTVIYGIPNFNGNLTRADLQRPSPYNTYLNRGLPPGPIASPGLAALRAAASPADSPYLYFVARGDGSHQFSATLREHNRAVRKYQLHRSR